MILGDLANFLARISSWSCVTVSKATQRWSGWRGTYRRELDLPQVQRGDSQLFSY